MRGMGNMQQQNRFQKNHKTYQTKLINFQSMGDIDKSQKSNKTDSSMNSFASKNSLSHNFRGARMGAYSGSGNIANLLNTRAAGLEKI
jgi:hypothetical protein